MILEWPVILASFLLGLAGAPHCFGMCGGISCAAGALRGGRSAVLVANLYRVVTYAGLGAATGALLQPLGSLSNLDPWLRVAVGTCMLAAGLLVLRGRGTLELPLPFMRRLAGRLQRAGSGSAMYFGIGWGLLPCGMVYTALLMNAAGGAPLASALGMLAFGVGTLPAVGGAGLALRWIAGRPALRPVYGALVLLLGAGTLTHALTTLPRAAGQDHVHGSHLPAMPGHPHARPPSGNRVGPTATGTASRAAERSDDVAAKPIDAGQVPPGRSHHNHLRPMCAQRPGAMHSGAAQPRATTSGIALLAGSPCSAIACPDADGFAEGARAGRSHANDTEPTRRRT